MSKTRQANSGESPAWGDGWSVGLRLWVERAGQAILGSGRLELLEGIDREHSISAAARHMGMSYRRAWDLVQSVNQSAGKPLVTSVAGGLQGGGAQLTPLGRWAVAVYRQMQNQVRRTAAGLLPQLVERGSAIVVHLAAAVSLEEAVGQLLIDYALHDPTVKVRAVFGSSDELADHLLAGSPGDLFLTADAQHLERLARAGLVERDSAVVLAENGLAAIGLTERLLPIRKPADLRNQDWRHIALAAPNCPLGGYTRTYLDSLRLYDRTAPRAIFVDNSRAVVAAVRAGQADLGLVYSSDAVRAEGCRTLFRVRRTSTPIQYQGAVLHQAQAAEPARRLLEFLISADAVRRFRTCGFHPVGAAKSRARST